jgi:hypothetical protein
MKPDQDGTRLVVTKRAAIVQASNSARSSTQFHEYSVPDGVFRNEV